MPPHTLLTPLHQKTLEYSKHIPNTFNLWIFPCLFQTDKEYFLNNHNLSSIWKINILILSLLSRQYTNILDCFKKSSFYNCFVQIRIQIWSANCIWLTCISSSLIDLYKFPSPFIFFIIYLLILTFVTDVKINTPDCIKRHLMPSCFFLVLWLMGWSRCCQSHSLIIKLLVNFSPYGFNSHQ